MEPPPDGHSQEHALPSVLNGHSDPVVPVPPVDKPLDEWHADKHAPDHDGVTYSEDKSVSGDQPPKGSREDGPIRLPRVIAGPNEEQGESDPEQRVEPSKLVRSGLDVCTVES